MNIPAVFLDRDGVINYNRDDYVKSWAEFVFLPGALDALRRLARLPWPIVVVSNQAIIGRGLVDAATVEAIHARMASAVAEAGGRVDLILCCPHRPDEDCDCRKPRPGLLLQAAARLGLDLSRSILVGDARSDILAARAAGCHPILVKSGRGGQQLALLERHELEGLYVAEDLAQAVEWILGRDAEPVWPGQSAVPG